MFTESPKDIRDYTLVEKNDLGLLASEVRTLLHCGWELHGSPFLRDGSDYVCQALVNKRIVNRKVKWLKDDAGHRSECGFYRVSKIDDRLVLFCDGEIIGNYGSLLDCFDAAEITEAHE
tara:strand:+ start:2120 stop:2476 length:357 start_codon:yes stop_codon:yes gene_type:complete